MLALDRPKSPRLRLTLRSQDLQAFMSDIGEEFQLPPNDENVAAKTLDSKTLEPPKTRLGDSWAIRDRVAEMKRNDETRAKKRAKIQNWMEGARPYNERKLIELGQGDRTNFNPREAQGMRETARTPFYGLVFRSPLFAQIECSYGSNPDLREQWSTTISRNFHRALKEWSGFDYQMQLKQGQMVDFGVGIPMFKDEDDWQWEHCRIGNFLVPDKTPALVDMLTEASYFTTVNAVDLFKTVDKTGAEDQGWYVERVKALIVKKAPEAVRSPGTQGGFGLDWSEQWADSLRRGDVVWNAEKNQIDLVGYLLKEFNGKISQVLLVNDGQAPDPRDPGASDALLLFKKVGRFECFDQIVQPFFFDVGMGDWHSVGGLGQKITDNTRATARLLCGAIDGAVKSSSLLLQAQDAPSEQISQIIEIGGANIIPSGLALQQNRLNESLEAPMAMRRELEGINQNTTGQFQQRISQDNVLPTLGQEQLAARQQVQLSEAASDRYCQSLGRLYKEKVRRMALMGIRLYKRYHKDGEMPPDDYEMPDNLTDSETGAYWFVRRCIEEQTPIEALDPKWFCSVQAMRGVGSGSPAAMDISTQQGMAMLGVLPEYGRNYVIRLRAAFLFGEQNVDQIQKPLDQLQTPDDQASMATLENNALRQRDGEVLLTSTQNHPIHFGTHYSDLANHFKALQAGQGNPIELLTHAHQAGPHMWAHLNQMEGDPSRKDMLDRMRNALMDLSKLTEQLQQQVMESMKAQQQAQSQQPQQPQMDPAMLAAIIKAQGELQIKDYVAKGKLAIQARTQEAKNRLKDLDQAQSMRLRNIETASNLTNERAKTVSGLANELVKTIAAIQPEPTIPEQAAA